MATTSYQIVYWRAIPAQVKVKIGRARVSKPLSDRFQVAIDEAAMRAGMIGTDDYLAEWRTSDAMEKDGEPESVASAVVVELESAYPDDRLKMLVDNWGREL
jgi:hypothetical protein